MPLGTRVPRCCEPSSTPPSRSTGCAPARIPAGSDRPKIRRLSSRTHRLDRSFLAEQLQGARSYRRIAGYFTSSLFEVAHEWLESVPDVRIVCNVDLSPEDLKVAQLREARMLGRWNERSIEAESLLNRERYQRLDAFLAKRGQVIRVAPDSLCGFLQGKAGVIERADGRKVAFIGSMNETRHGWQNHYEILWEDDSPEGIAWIEAEFEFLWNAARPLPEAVCREVRRRGRRYEVGLPDIEAEDVLAPATLIRVPPVPRGHGPTTLAAGVRDGVPAPLQRPWPGAAAAGR